MKRTTFSIITVCFNSSKTIKNTFESVLNQSYNNFEYIIIDGNSTDGTIDIIKEYENLFNKKGIKFTWKSEPDNGIYDAMNKGIRLSTGVLIGILNSDDTFETNALFNINQSYIKNPNYDVYHGMLKYINNGVTTMIRGSNSNILEKNMIEHPACFVKLQVYRMYGEFSLEYKFVSDYEFLLRIKRAGCKFLLIDSIISNFDENGAGNSYYSRMELIKLKKKYKIVNNIELIYNVSKVYIREVKDRMKKI